MKVAVEVRSGSGYRIVNEAKYERYYVEMNLSELLDTVALSNDLDAFGLELLDEEECPSVLVSPDKVLVWACRKDGVD